MFTFIPVWERLFRLVTPYEPCTIVNFTPDEAILYKERSSYAGDI